jgi:hypothetical protein
MVMPFESGDDPSETAYSRSMLGAAHVDGCRWHPTVEQVADASVRAAERAHVLTTPPPEQARGG